MAMPITKPAAAWRVRRKQSSRIDTGSGRTNSAKISQSGSLFVSFSMLSATMKTINIQTNVATRPSTIPTATAQPLTSRGGSGDGSPGGGASPYGLLLTRTGSQNTA